MTQLDAVAKEKALIDKTNEDLESKLKSVGEKHKEHCCRMDEIIQKDKGNLENVVNDTILSELLDTFP